MGALAWYRAARKVVGLSPLPEFPNLEALLESEEGEADEDFRLLARIIPPAIGIVGTVIFGWVAWVKHPAFALGVLGMWAVAGALWLVFDRMDKSISRSKARVRKLSKEIWERYHSLGHIIGAASPVAPSVAAMLDDAAAIYLKHAASDAKSLDEPRIKAIRAIETAMARMLDLAMPVTVGAQELELGAGWAQPLLQEMKEIDKALDRYAIADSQGLLSGDPLAGLREARLELQGIETAVGELEQTRLNS